LAAIARARRGVRIGGRSIAPLASSAAGPTDNGKIAVIIGIIVVTAIGEFNIRSGKAKG
jgi:hypothetical protein